MFFNYTLKNLTASISLLSPAHATFFNGIGIWDFNSCPMSLLKLQREPRWEKCNRKDTVKQLGLRSIERKMGKTWALWVFINTSGSYRQHLCRSLLWPKCAGVRGGVAWWHFKGKRQWEAWFLPSAFHSHPGAAIYVSSPCLCVRLWEKTDRCVRRCFCV